MKRKAVQIVLSLTLTAAMCFGAPAMAFAGETTAKEESTDKTEAKDSTEEKEEAKDFQIERACCKISRTSGSKRR